MSIGQKIRKLRRDRDLTQQELGEKAGINFRNLPNYESGRMKPGLKVLTKLAEAFEIPLEDLVANGEHEEPRISVNDPELRRCFEILEQMNDDDRNTAKNMLQALIFRHQVQSLGGHQTAAGGGLR